MNLRLFPGFAALGCALLASCYPYPEGRDRPPVDKPPEKTVTSTEQQKLQAQRDEMKKKADEAKKESGTEIPGDGPRETSAGTSGTKPPTEQKRDYGYAVKVPGKDGFVLSPYNNKEIDVRDIPTNTLVADPTYPASEKKYFRVP